MEVLRYRIKESARETREINSACNDSTETVPADFIAIRTAGIACPGYSNLRVKG